MSDADNVLSLSVADFLDATAAKTATPGGGSVAGVVGALAASLAEMALNFTRGKKKYAEYEAYHEQIGERLEKTRGMFQMLVTDDIEAYKLYQSANRQPDGPDKVQAVQLATAAAINVPREATKLALALLSDLRELQDKCNPYLITDLLAAGVLAVATIRLSDYNVRINVPAVEDQTAGEEINQASRSDLKKAQSLAEEIERAAAELLP